MFSELFKRPESVKDGFIKVISMGKVPVGTTFRYNKVFYKKHTIDLAYSIVPVEQKYDFVDVTGDNSRKLVAIEI